MYSERQLGEWRFGWGNAADGMMQVEMGVGKCKVRGAAGRGDIDAENWAC